MRLFKTIKFRLTIWYVVVIVVLLAIFSAISYELLSRDMFTNLDKSLKSRVTELQESLKSGDSEMLFVGSLTEATLFYNSNHKLVQSLGPHIEFAGIDGLIDKALLGLNSFTTITTSDGQEMRLYVAHMAFDSRTQYAVVVGRSPADIKRFLDKFASILGISALAIVALVGIGGAFLASRTLKPVDLMTGTAQDITENDLSRRIDVKSEDELGRLASTLNKMIERLEVAFKRQRQFTADASHEMRTPLAVIQAESTLALEKERSVAEYRKSMELISHEIDYMSEVIGKLLFLARSDAGKEPLKIEDVNLSELITQVGTDMEVLARDKGLGFSVASSDGLTVKGDKVKLRQVLINLMSNAIRYTPSGGSVSTTIDRQKDKAIISVADTGIGIAPEHLPLIFERFYRVDKARSRSEGGSGLGLAIANHIAQDHKGRIEVESEVGKGSTFRLILPITSC